MRLVFGLVLILGLALAGGAVYMAKNYMSAQEQALARERAARAQMVETVPVYVATRMLKYGEVINPEDVQLVPFPVQSLPEGVFHKKEDFFPKGEEVLRAAQRVIEKNEAIMQVKVTEPGVNDAITARLEQGMRAFAIKVDASSGVSGFLKPGDRVDVYWTGRVGSVDGLSVDRGEITKLIETGVLLIAVDQTADSGLSEATIARTVTVSATPQQVASLAQAQSTGNLSLSLLRDDDQSVANVIEVDQSTLLGLTAAPAPIIVEKQKVCTVRKRSGETVVDVEIPCTD